MPDSTTIRVEEADYLTPPYTWMVSGDLRKPHSGLDDSNHDYADAASRITLPMGLDVKYDPEMCEFFAYTKDQCTAEQLAFIMRQVTVERWIDDPPQITVIIEEPIT